MDVSVPKRLIVQTLEQKTGFASFKSTTSTIKNSDKVNYFQAF